LAADENGVLWVWNGGREVMKYESSKWTTAGIHKRIQYITAGLSSHVYIKAGQNTGAWARQVLELQEGGYWRSVGEKAARSLAIGPKGRIYLNDGGYRVF